MQLQPYHCRFAVLAAGLRIPKGALAIEYDRFMSVCRTYGFIGLASLATNFRRTQNGKQRVTQGIIVNDTFLQTGTSNPSSETKCAV